MTTFDEAARALVWGRELLEDLVEDPRVQKSVSASAARLLAGYPASSSIETRLEDLSTEALTISLASISGTWSLVLSLSAGAVPHLADRAQRIAWHFPRIWPSDAETSERARSWAAQELNRSPGMFGLVAEASRHRRLGELEAQARADGWIDANGFWRVRPGEEALP